MPDGTHLSRSDATIRRSFKTEQRAAERRALSHEVLRRAEQLLKRIHYDLKSDQADTA
jgi:hypothetical protein